MDGIGRSRDNARMARFWGALKYENLLIRCYESVQELSAGVDRYVEFYNREHTHSALNYQTPEMVYESGKEAGQVT